MKKLLVTGGAGFIGTNFVYYWLNKYPEDHIVVLDALTYAGNRVNLIRAEKNPKFKFVHGNILDQPLVETLLKDHNIDTIVHFAAESHVDRSIHGPDEFINTNIVGTHTLLKAAKKIWLDSGSKPHRFHHISTDEVYGTLGPDHPPFTELTPYAPNSPYAASKASSDHLVRAYHETYGLDTTISNCSNNYGPFQFPEKLIPLVIINILFNKPLPIYGDGKQIRDWLYVDDHNRGVDLILKKGTPGQTYNIGGTNEWANIDIVHLICDLLLEQFSSDKSLSERFAKSPAAQAKHPATLISHVKDRAGHDRRYAINAEKIKDDLEFIPEESFETGIRKTLTWFLEHQPWWKQLLNDSYKDWITTNYS
ncbi:dTDP-glucose 4,6-dehydratase [Desulfobacter sp.]|jgi:dTDP-glucose 4,6-dehydratase|uniref:dTDP-glucose 4,6-dehydratase n=1 Tax=Desulfobacter sp. TaxID=2294 RepID=UPI000E8F4D38|nr:dTDP-glucose 4,6-dehydratase [Desulfobacter sp.]MBP8828877.1 dTDP-glucose 4,6-dehydratase [Desulfobacter sp.]MBP9599650.1 dTDP-glucose 4,6-dehydratase [Desulfobacter sp.]MDQ1270187.1 dTDP-glucose 4,6-dehydratase [Thermodesulfobacteriota bacterium]HBT89472.1 dTDP-glucose 4,6-dehydratase [Desulfobacter sp.]